MALDDVKKWVTGEMAERQVMIITEGGFHAKSRSTPFDMTVAELRPQD